MPNVCRPRSLKLHRTSISSALSIARMSLVLSSTKRLFLDSNYPTTNLLPGSVPSHRSQASAARRKALGNPARLSTTQLSKKIPTANLSRRKSLSSKQRIQCLIGLTILQFLVYRRQNLKTPGRIGSTAFPKTLLLRLPSKNSAKNSVRSSSARSALKGTSQARSSCRITSVLRLL